MVAAIDAGCPLLLLPLLLLLTASPLALNPCRFEGPLQVEAALPAARGAAIAGGWAGPGGCHRYCQRHCRCVKQPSFPLHSDDAAAAMLAAGACSGGGCARGDGG